MRELPMKYFIALIIALLFNACANLLMKAGAKSVADAGGMTRNGLLGTITSVMTTPHLLLGLAFFALNALFYMYALQSRALKISIAYPIMVGGGFALIALVARFHPGFAERLTGLQMVGVALILLGIILVASRMELSP